MPRNLFILLCFLPQQLLPTITQVKNLNITLDCFLILILTVTKLFDLCPHFLHQVTIISDISDHTSLLTDLLLLDLPLALLSIHFVQNNLYNVQI